MPSAEVGSARVVLGMNAGEFTRGTKKAAKGMDDLADKAKKLGTAIGAAFATDQIRRFAGEAVRLFGVQEEAIASVEAVLKTTGGAAGKTSKELQDLASSMQEVTKFGDEDILRGATSNLLTFGNIVGPVFDRAQAAALDLSQQFNVGLKESAIQLGKALNDPITGISALSRVGIAFTQQQKDQIKTLIESNKVMEAQGVILDEIEKFYGQAAEAAAQTTSGAMQQAANAFGDAMESIGQTIAPVVIAASKAIKDLSNAFIALSPEVKRFIVFGAGITAVVTPAVIAIGALVAVFGAVAAPILAAAAAVGVITGTIAAFWPNLKRLAKLAATAFSDIYVSAKTWLLDALKPVIDKVKGIITSIGDAFKALREAIGLEDVGEAVTNTVGAIVPAVKLGVDSINEALKTTAGGDVKDSVLGKLAEMRQAIADAWNGPMISAEDAETQTANMVMPFIATADQAKAAKKAADDLQRAKEAHIQKGIDQIDALKTPYDIMLEKEAQILAAFEARKISAAQAAQAQVMAAAVAQNAYAGMASSIAGNLEGLFGQSKGFAIAQAIINTYEAFTKALAAYPPPFNYAVAASTLAAGLAQVQKIKSTNSKSSGGGSSTGSSSSSTGGATQAPQRLIVEGVTADTLMGGVDVGALVERIRDHERNGGDTIFR